MFKLKVVTVDWMTVLNLGDKLIQCLSQYCEGRNSTEICYEWVIRQKNHEVCIIC